MQAPSSPQGETLDQASLLGPGLYLHEQELLCSHTAHQVAADCHRLAQASDQG